jgi:3-oxoacyl-[acyl-carrier protein] reductase
MTKAAVIQLTRSLAAELGPRGVRVNAVAPGYVETAMTSRVWTGADGTIDAEARARAIDARAAGSPLGRTGRAEDIAWTMLFLASDASGFYTGQVLRPNGGVYMS